MGSLLCKGSFQKRTEKNRGKMKKKINVDTRGTVGRISSLPPSPLPSSPFLSSPLPSPPLPPLPLFSLHSAAEERVKWVFWAKGFVQNPANDCWDSKAELLQNSSVYFRSDLLRHKKHSSVYKYINISLIHN